MSRRPFSGTIQSVYAASKVQTLGASAPPKYIQLCMLRSIYKQADNSSIASPGETAMATGPSQQTASTKPAPDGKTPRYVNLHCVTDLTEGKY